MPGSNTRHHPRIRTDLTARIGSWNGRWIMQVRNLSQGGMQVLRGRALLAPGDPVHLRFRVPPATAPVDCDGEVVYRDGEHVGIRFVTLSQTEQRAVQRFLDDRPGAAGYH